DEQILPGPGYADDLDPGSVGIVEMEAFAERVLIRPVDFGEFLIDDGDSPRALFVISGKGPTADYFGIHGLEVVLVDDVREQRVGGLAFQKRVALRSYRGHVLVGNIGNRP